MTTKNEALERVIESLAKMIACHDDPAHPAIGCVREAIAACREALAHGADENAMLRDLIARRPAMNRGVLQAYVKWDSECHAATAIEAPAANEGVHLDVEQECADRERDLNCPACGGSGHVDDVKPDALAQKDEREPVAWMRESWSPDCGPYIEIYDVIGMGLRDRSGWTPLYTAAPEIKPLTDEEIGTLWNRFCDEMGYVSPHDADNIVHEIEAHHGIGGEA